MVPNKVELRTGCCVCWVLCLSSDSMAGIASTQMCKALLGSSRLKMRFGNCIITWTNISVWIPLGSLQVCDLCFLELKQLRASPTSHTKERL